MTNKSQTAREKQSAKECFCNTHNVEDLVDYFTKCDFDSAFELKVSNAFPELYVQAVRATKTFLKKERHDFLLNEVVLPEALSAHQRMWKTLYGIVHDFQDKLTESLNSI